jgi:hypothetical protein
MNLFILFKNLPKKHFTAESPIFTPDALKCVHPNFIKN